MNGRFLSPHDSSDFGLTVYRIVVQDLPIRGPQFLHSSPLLEIL